MDQPGTRIGRYRIVETLGSGGFSTVYRAVDEQLDAEVALKVLAENHALDADLRERFLAEARLLRRIETLSVVPVHDVGETERRQPYIVMALAVGGDLGTRVAQLDLGGATPGLGTGSDLTQARYQVHAADVVSVVEALATSLGAAHEAGVVHRDVKPSNLLIVQDKPGALAANGSGRLLDVGERLVLSDLGLAKDTTAGSGLTVGAGTAGFAAPEQLNSASTITKAVDIHAATAVVFWLLTRAVPTTEESWGQIPRELVPVLRRGLSRNPDERHRTMGEWREAVTDTLRSGRNVTGAKSRRKLRVRLCLAIAGLLVVGSAAGAAGYVLGTASDVATRLTTEDGTRQVEVSRAGVELIVRGPSTAVAGEEVLLEATTTSDEDILWIVPSGETSIGDSLQLTTRRPGTAIITVATGVENERALVAEFTLDVTE